MGQNQQKYSIADMRLAIEEVGASPAKIAKRLNCASGTVYSYIKRYPEVKAAFEKAKGATVEDKPLYPKELFIKSITNSMGIKSAIVKRAGCSRQTLDNAIERWPELGVLIDEERSRIVDLAESKLLQQVDAGEMRAILFTLETLGKDRGWSKRTEVTGRDGAALLDVPPDLIKQIEASGLNFVEVLRNFVAMMPAGG